METGATGDAVERFEDALVLFRNGDDRLAHQEARVLLERAPGHVGGMMLLLATAAGCGEEHAINDALLEIAGYYERMLAVPQVLDLLQSELLAPVVGSHTFRTIFAPALLQADFRTRERGGREVMGRLIQEAARDAAVEAALARAPLGTAPAMDCEDIHVVDMATGETIANLHGDGPHLVGRLAEADVSVDDVFASRKHLQLARRAGLWIAQSLMPTNPPVLNGRVMDLMPAPLRHGDELRVGHAVLCVFSGPGEAVVAPDPLEVEAFVRTHAAPAERRDVDPTYKAWRPPDGEAAELQVPPVRPHA